MRRCTEDRAAWLAVHLLPHEAALRSYISRWTLPSTLDPDDVIQEVYSKLASMESVADIQKPRNYAYMIARSTILMHVRHARVVSIRAIDATDSACILSDDPSPEQFASDRQQLHLLGMALSEFPERSRRTFLLRMVEGLSHREIAARLGMSENAVQKSIAKSISRLLLRIEWDGNANAGASRKNSRRGKFEDDDTARDERGNR